MFGVPGQHVLNILNNGAYPHVDSSLIEECGELISVLSKHHNREYIDDFDVYRNRVIEEMTHVLVSMNMVCPLLNISEEDIKREIMRKAQMDNFDTSKYEW